MKTKEDVMKTARFAAILAAVVSISAAAFAGSSESLLQTEAAFSRSLGVVILPVGPKDAFAGLPECGVLSVKPFRAFTLLEAVDALEPCVKAVSARYGLTVTAAAGSVDGTAGIRLLVKGTLPAGSTVMMDLFRGINLHDGQLLGFRVALSREGEPAAVFKSAVQAAVDRCILPMLVRKIENSADFVRYYGGCISRDPALKVKSIRPAAGRSLGVTILSDGEKAEVETLNGSVVVNSGTGPVSILVMAYPNEIVLP